MHQKRRATDKSLSNNKKNDCECGGGGGYRTPDPRLMSPLLYQLSYTATRGSMYQGVRLTSRSFDVRRKRQTRMSLADEVWVEAVQRLNRIGLDLVEDDCTAGLPEPVEDAFHDDLLSFMDFHFPQCDHLERAPIAGE